MLPVDRPSDITSLGIADVPGAKILTDWSRDGRFIMFKAVSEQNGANDLWAIPLDGDRKSFPIATAAFDERDGQFSPDGQCVAFESDESGVSEIYVQAFPGPGRRARISTDGGSQVRWRADGREIYYLRLDETLMAVPIECRGSEIPTIGTAAKLFVLTLAPVRAISRQQYVVSNDGQRFLAVESAPALLPPVTLLLNWKGLAQR